MMRCVKLIVLLYVMFLMTVTSLAAEARFETKDLGSGFYLLQGVDGFTGGNILISSGIDGVVMIDDSMPPFLDKLNSEIKKAVKKPLDYLINTHAHGDHIGNNEAFAKQGVHIVAHKNIRKYLLKNGIGASTGKPAPLKALPVITFSQSMAFHINDEDAHIIHLPHAHTDGDAIIRFDKANIIHTGDIFFNGMFPFIDIESGGDVNGYIAAQEKILAMANKTTRIIPGHGPLAKKKDLETALSMLKESKKIISEAIKKGLSEEELVKLNPLSKYHDQWNWGFITTEKMTRQVYKSLKTHRNHSH